MRDRDSRSPLARAASGLVWIVLMLLSSFYILSRIAAAIG